MLGAGTGESDGESADDDESSGSSAALHALEAHLSRGHAFAENDDYGDSLDSRIDFAATEAGTYTVVAADLGDEGGAYALRVRGAGPNAAPTATE